jgi:hypothetical protein
MGDNVLWAVFRKLPTYKSGPHFGATYFHGRGLHQFDKNVLGYISGYFLTYSSGHPVQEPTHDMCTRMYVIK